VSDVIDTSGFNGSEIAVVGMTGRFPGAADLTAFWQNLRDGVESITPLSEDDLLAAGVDPALFAHPNYVKVAAVLDGVDWFDAAFFGLSPREAEVMDPQHRLLLECAWEVLENAGYDPERYAGLIGVFAGASINNYQTEINQDPRHGGGSGGSYETTLANEKDFLTTRVSFKLNLKGPSLDVQTSCSTSLVAVHLACQSLLTYQCDLALAGGVSAPRAKPRGYLFQEGMILSPDGHCRAFDRDAGGTIPGRGVGVVALRRLPEAVEDGDNILAVIRGSAINNDGSAKVSYTAPSVTGQAEVIAEALAAAGVSADTITCVEAHGTGTKLGDPAEVAALTKAFRADTRRTAYCAIGSVKTNIGHLDAAAGISGFVKAVLALGHKQIPASLYFNEPNPEIDFANSPFRVNAALSDWKKTNGVPRRIGVSSFGIGGTNAHLILEESPVPQPRPTCEAPQLLVMSTRTPTALGTATENLVAHLKDHRNVDLQDVAFTLQTGRRQFPHRRAVACSNVRDAIDALESSDSERVFSGVSQGEAGCVFLFSGQGAQYVNMGAGLYEAEPAFKDEIDRCSEILRAPLGLDLRTVIYPGLERVESATEQLNRTKLAQPALFVVSYALARLWMARGIKPIAMAGHSIGEYVAACLAGVFSLEDALKIVAHRGAVMDEQPPGAMLAVPLPVEEVKTLIDDDLSIAVVNGESLCVVSGPEECVAALDARLKEQGLSSRRLHTSHAFHSAMMDEAVEPLVEVVTQVSLRPPQIPYVSNLSGTWVTDEQATDPGYWGCHLRSTVRFSDDLAAVLDTPARLLMEVGPGHTLIGLLRQHSKWTADRVAVATLRHPEMQEEDAMTDLRALGKAFVAGAPIDWSELHRQHTPRRVPLPTYPFERECFELDVRAGSRVQSDRIGRLTKNPDIADWFYVPAWKTYVPPAVDHAADQQDKDIWLVFHDGQHLTDRIVGHMIAQGQKCIQVTSGGCYSASDDGTYTVRPTETNDYKALLDTLDRKNIPFNRVAHSFSCDFTGSPSSDIELFDFAQRRGFHSLVCFVQAIVAQGYARPIDIKSLTRGLYALGERHAVWAEAATTVGLGRVIAQEVPNLRCYSVDLPADDDTGLAAVVADELLSRSRDPVVALRDQGRSVLTYEPVRLPTPVAPPCLRERGVYVITGGLGSVGGALAEYLAETVQARLVLTSRSPFPRRADWDDWLRSRNDDDLVVRRIRKLQRLEAAGARTLVLQADAGDLSAMTNIFECADEAFGEVNGVIHAAGILDRQAFQLVKDLDVEECRRQFRAKVHGACVLRAILAERDIDFCLLISSVSSVLGGIGYGAYAAANAFLDAFAHSQHQSGRREWRAINWDSWRFGTSSKTDGRISEVDRLAMTKAEGINAFARILAAGSVPQIAVSTADLQSRWQRWTNPQIAPQQRKAAPEQVARYARPSMAVEYASPCTVTERQLADIWQELLGIKNIGIRDNFFELGGHSLMATQVLSRITERLEVNVPLAEFFSLSTIQKLGEYIDGAMAPRNGGSGQAGKSGTREEIEL